MRARRSGFALLIVLGTSVAVACTFGDLDGTTGGAQRVAADASVDVTTVTPFVNDSGTPTTPPPDAAPVCVPEPVPLPADAGDGLRYQICGTATDATDLFHDGANCGQCGHDCQGLTCDVGRCVPAVVAEPILFNQEFGGTTDGTNVYTLIDFNNNGTNSYGWVTHRLDGSDDGGAPSSIVADGIGSGEELVQMVASSGTLYSAFNAQGGGHLLRASTTGTVPAMETFPPGFSVPAATPASIGLRGTTVIFGVGAPNTTAIGTLDLLDAGVGDFIQDRKQPAQVSVSPNQKIVAWVESPNGSPTDVYIFTDRPYLVATNPSAVGFLTADDDFLYFISAKQVLRVPTSATSAVTPEVVTESDSLISPSGLTFDRTHLFWAGSANGGGSSTITTRAKCALPELVLADAIPNPPQHLFSSGTTLFYLTTDRRLFRVAK